MGEPINTKLPPIVLGRYEPDVTYEAGDAPESDNDEIPEDAECNISGVQHMVLITNFAKNVAEDTVAICDLAMCSILDGKATWEDVYEALIGLYGIENAGEAEVFITRFHALAHGIDS